MTDSPHRPHDPTSVLRNPGSAVHAVYLHARRLTSLQRAVQRHLPASVQVASFDDGALHLVTDNASLATQIRYNQRDVIDRLRGHPDFTSLRSLRIVVRPGSPPPKRKTRERPPMSAETASRITTSAQYIEDESLRKALTELARNAARRGPQP